MLNTGLVPGNRNADNIDHALADRDLLLFPSQTLNMSGAGGLKAFSVMSFGFGQKGAQVIGVHPSYVFASISGTEYEAYRSKVEKRKKRADRFFQEALCGGKLVNLKDDPVFDATKLEETFLNGRH